MACHLIFINLILVYLACPLMHAAQGHDRSGASELCEPKVVAHGQPLLHDWCPRKLQEPHVVLCRVLALQKAFMEFLNADQMPSSTEMCLRPGPADTNIV